MTQVTIDSEFRITIPYYLRAEFPTGRTVTMLRRAKGEILISRLKKYSLEELLSATPTDSIIPDWESMPNAGLESK
jgi:bifunctional DNA-binding transcriptional regulator/antitoxin component of YhaV-PrlF toxin-antitoxin module